MRLIVPDLSPTEWLTLALVVITAYYAWQNRRMANEMRTARAVAVLPKVVPSIKIAAPDIAWIRVSNVGPGPALEVNASITLEPGGWKVEWLAHVVAPAETHDFIPKRPGPGSTDIIRLTALTEEFSHVRLQGSCRDGLGGAHRIDERIEIREWWRKLQAANHLRDRDELHELRVEVEKLRKAMERVADNLKRWFDVEHPDDWAIDFRWKQRVDRLPGFLRAPAWRLIRLMHPDPDVWR
jgi:hypothetical protein